VGSASAPEELSGCRCFFGDPEALLSFLAIHSLVASGLEVLIGLQHQRQTWWQLGTMLMPGQACCSGSCCRGKCVGGLEEVALFSPSQSIDCPSLFSLLRVCFPWDEAVKCKQCR
jgi:hypothetical protein